MAKSKAVSNEQIIAAILSNGTFEKAADACGITSRTIRERMKDPDFKADYLAAKDDITRQAVQRLEDQLTAAVDVIAEIMTNKDNNAAVRLQAAQTILNNAGKLEAQLKESEKATRRANSGFAELMDESLFDL